MSRSASPAAGACRSAVGAGRIARSRRSSSQKRLPHFGGQLTEEEALLCVPVTSSDIQSAVVMTTSRTIVRPHRAPTVPSALSATLSLSEYRPQAEHKKRDRSHAATDDSNVEQDKSALVKSAKSSGSPLVQMKWMSKLALLLVGVTVVESLECDAMNANECRKSEAKSVASSSILAHNGNNGITAAVQASSTSIRSSDGLLIQGSGSLQSSGSSCRIDLSVNRTMTMRSSLTIPGSTAAVVAAELDTQDTSLMHTNGCGHVSGLGQGSDVSSGGGAGGGLGGAGSAGQSKLGQAGQVYGGASFPQTAGSGGGKGWYSTRGQSKIPGGTGGCVINVSLTWTFSLASGAQLQANSAAGLNGKGNTQRLSAGGGGSGGSVLVSASQDPGSGVMEASGRVGGTRASYDSASWRHGQHGDGGGGSGGRVAVYAASSVPSGVTMKTKGGTVFLTAGTVYTSVSGVSSFVLDGTLTTSSESASIVRVADFVAALTDCMGVRSSSSNGQCDDDGPG